jgi:hypothetical protein
MATAAPPQHQHVPMPPPSTPGGSSASSSRPGTVAGSPRALLRSELLAARKSELLSLNSARFGDRTRRGQEVGVKVKPFTVPAPPQSPEAVSRTARFHPQRIFKDAAPPRESHTGLPAIPSVRRSHAPQEAAKPTDISSPRYLNAKLPSTTRPNTGTLNEGAPMYSCFSNDTVYRGSLPRGALELTMGLTCGGSMSGTARGVFGRGLQQPVSKTLIR